MKTVVKHAALKAHLCQECGQSFSRKGNLKRHQCIHMAEELFACGECAHLLAHQKIHLHGGPFICTECGKSLSTKRCFNAHQRNHAKEKPLKGHINDAPLRVIQIKEETVFKSAENVLECLFNEGAGMLPKISYDPKSPHWKTQTKEEPGPPTYDTESITAIACQKLLIKEEPQENLDYGKLFDPELSLMALQGREVRKERDSDGQHDQKSPIPGNRLLHVKEEPQESTEFETRCGQKPNLSATQRIQIKEKAGVKDDRQETQSPKKKKKKRNQPTKEGTLERQEKSTSTRDLSTKRAPGGERIFPCPECGKSFNQKSNLTRHQKIHVSEGPYKCSECGESFRMSRKLVRHQRAHLSEPFKCTECGKSFTQRSNLVRHQRIHTKEEPYQCPECEKTFNQKANLFRHQTIHVRMGPCKCTKCGKCFPQKHHLVKHQLLHSRGGAYKCGVCGKRYRLQKYLRRHQKIHAREGAGPSAKCGEDTRPSGGSHPTEQRALDPVMSKEGS